MEAYLEKRKCSRFEVPGSEVRYKKSGLTGFMKSFSSPFPLVNLSKGGLAFNCNQRIGRNRKIRVQLMLPGEVLVELRARVMWQGRKDYNGERITGVAFMPFGHRRGWNSREILQLLKKLDARYADKQMDASQFKLDKLEDLKYNW